MANIVFAGLETRMEQELGRVLGNEGHAVRAEQGLDTADAVFCNGDMPSYPEFLRKLRALRPNLPVVVVTRLPEVAKWLDALEQGAADYCSAPFEAIQIRWILSSVLRPQAAASALK
jgi:DNA-binding NtrC family response regulator